MGSSDPEHVKAILSGRRERRLAAAQKLSRAAVTKLGHILPRGTLAVPAEPTGVLTRTETEQLLDCARQSLETGDTAIAHEVLACLRYAAGSEASRHLLELFEGHLGRDSSDDSASMLLGTLVAIGGEDAMKAITLAIKKGSRDMRTSAKEAFRALATGGKRDDTEETLTFPVGTTIPGGSRGAEAVRTRGAVRVRGERGRRSSDTATVRDLRGALESLKDSDDKYLRSRVQELQDLL